MSVRSAGLAVVLAIGWATAAGAAPLDYRLISGTLVWPARFTGEPRAVVRGDDGVTYFLEMSRPELSPRTVLNAGDRVSVVGREALEPGRLLDAAIDRDVGALASIPSEPNNNVAAVPPVPLPAGWRQFRGAVASVDGSRATVISRDGRSMRIDLVGVAAEIRDEVRPGQQILALGPYANGTLTAQGLVINHGLTPGR
jgi:hypothetical protein